MFWLLRMWLLAVILIVGWAITCYMLTRNREYLYRARLAIRWSAYVAGLVALFWVARRFLL
ncbi:hypothetical protein QU481_09040 [Crenobacter sp. SG2303]|uniref:Uncharacterized protein n=1 Tax=Crenobacter oryzisoli TaxID=3056844 RepID=A0ABT7XMP4_9NEIS|nr:MULTISPECIES: hypothetical protein [unclassified Crenobacter]MDN0075041.1 hypothetical protein [Crenobacter sp. SG2303]MDN0081174.1 hypothetical protein [Crenobacter sp. SG2305]